MRDERDDEEELFGSGTRLISTILRLRVAILSKELTHAASEEELGGLAQLDKDRRVNEETDWNAVLALHSFRWREEECDEWTSRLDGDEDQVNLRVDRACRRTIGRESEVDSAAEDLIDSRARLAQNRTHVFWRRILTCPATRKLSHTPRNLPAFLGSG